MAALLWPVALAPLAAAADAPPPDVALTSQNGVLTAIFPAQTTTQMLNAAIPLLLARNVANVSLHGVPIEDITPLARLPGVRSLDLWGTQVKDLSPLAELHNLRSLDLQFAPVSDLRPLAGLANLRSLNLGCTKVDDLSPLADMANLESLIVAVTGVTDLRPLRDMRQLTSLDLGSTQVSDLRPLAHIVALRTLSLNGTPVEEVGPLEGMVNLRQLDLGGTQVADIRALATLQSLVSLNLEGSQVADISPLTRLTGLQALALGGSPAEGNAGSVKLAARTPAADASTSVVDAVLFWNDEANRAIQATNADPFAASRALALESIVALDTIRSIDGTPAVLVRLANPGEVLLPVAVSVAAHDLLADLFPSQRTALDAALARALAQQPAGARRERAQVLGRAMAENVMAMRATDGWNAAGTTRIGTALGQWQPTPPRFLPPMDPQWATMTPFMMTLPSQFRPAGPPPPDSPAFGRALATVAALGAADSRERTPDQTQIAHYWSDAIGTYAPAGHWNAIAASIVAPMHLGLAAEAELFAELNVAMADASIAMADAKYTFWSWRPITAIRTGDGNDPPEPNWTPLLDTPNHPSYVSGHSTFSGAAAVVLTAWFGKRSFTFSSASLPGVTRSFTSFDQAAEEAAASRVYGGIHFPFDNADGLATGRAIGAWTLAMFQRDAQERGPFIMVERGGGEGRAGSGQLMGCALDNLSPLGSVTARLDDGQPFSITVDPQGAFSLRRQELAGHRQMTLTATSSTGQTTAIRVAMDDGTVSAVQPVMSK